MTKNVCCAIWVCVLSLTSLCWGADRQNCVQIGAGNMPPTIVIDPDSAEAQRWAAQELATAIREMTGLVATVKATSHYSSVPADSFCFVLGVLETSAGLRPLVESGDLTIPEGRPNFDGFVLKSIRKDNRNILVIAGKESRAVLNGVFHLLERVWHCGFFEDTFETVRYPKYETLNVPIVDQIIEPAFEHREVIYLPNYANGSWPADRQYHNLDYLSRLRYNRFQYNWYLFTAAFAEELRGPQPADNSEVEPSRQISHDASVYDRGVKLLKYWRARDARVTFKKPSADGSYAVAIINKVHPGHFKFEQKDFVEQFDPNDELVFETDLESAKKLQTPIVETPDAQDNWYEMGPACEQSAWGTPEAQRAYLLNFARAGVKFVDHLAPKDGKLVLNGWLLIHSPWTIDDFKVFFDCIASKGKEVVVYDIMALDGVPRHQQNNFFYGHPWIVCAIPQIGVVDELHLNMPYALEMAKNLLKDSRAHPKENNLVGFAYQSEGSGGMPMTMDFLHLLAWDPQEWTIEKFVADYAARRYGPKSASAMIPALTKLTESVYSSKPKLLWGRYYTCSPHKTIRVTDMLDDRDGAFADRAALVPVVREALVKALEAEPVLKDDPYYVLDLMDIARMYCYYSEEIWLAQAWQAVKTSDAKKMQQACDAMDVILDSLTTLLATHSRYWNRSKSYGFEGNDYYTQDTYEQLEHLYAVRFRKQLELFKDLIARKQNHWPYKEACDWRTQLYNATRRAYDNGPSDWRDIPKAEQCPMPTMQAVRKLLAEVSSVNGD